MLRLSRPPIRFLLYILPSSARFAGIKLGLTEIKYTKTNRANGDDDEEYRKEKCIWKSCISTPFPHALYMYCGVECLLSVGTGGVPTHLQAGKCTSMATERVHKKNVKSYGVWFFYVHISFLRNFSIFTERGSSL